MFFPRNAIRSDSENKMTTGFARLGDRSNRQGTVNQQVHDGDTISVRADGNIGVRLLGIDTPEVSFSFPRPKGGFLGLGNSAWKAFLADPFDQKYGEFNRPVPTGLRRWIQSRIGPTAAATHFEHAGEATQTLRELVTRDQKVMGQDNQTFSFYLVFGYEVMDGYGRFLCLINRNQPRASVPAPRPPAYNQRMLERGRAFPYFIWPNINPYNRADSLTEAVVRPGAAAASMAENREVVFAQKAVARARENHIGLFDAKNPALLEPFELRYLARRQLPGRYLIDLSRNDDVLIHPLNYFSVPHPEDRLFVPRHFVPLFVERGWKKQPAPA